MANKFFLLRIAPIILGVLIFSGVSKASTRVTPRLCTSYPTNGAHYAHPQTSIGLRFNIAIDKAHLSDASVEVNGSLGGTYSGTVTTSLDGKTIIFTPNHPFELAEAVTVRCPSIYFLGSETPIQVSLSFTVRSQLCVPSPEQSDNNTEQLDESVFQNSGSQIKDHPDNIQSLPRLTVVNDDDPSDGMLYLANFNGVPSASNLLILDQNGSIIFSKQALAAPIYDFQPHKNGRYSYFCVQAKGYIILDSSFNTVDTMTATNGTTADGHELLYQPDGSYFITSTDNLKMDLRPYSPQADSNAMVVDCVIQQFDSAKHLLSEWRALDHFKVTDISPNEPFNHSPLVDFCHINGIDLDADGRLLVSCRNMDEITKIDPATGNIVWRLGGKNNQFTIIGDTLGFSHQHCIHHTNMGTYTFFDNGNFHTDKQQFSRGVEYRIDTTAMTAAQVWEFRHTPPLFANIMGSVERLENGNTLIGWGANHGAAVTEVGPFNTAVFEMAMDSQDISYRAYKYPQGYINTNAAVQMPTATLVQGTIGCVPNPVSSTSEININLPVSGSIRAVLYDELGKQVRVMFDGVLGGGNYSIPFDGRTLTNGAYHIHITSDTSAPLDEQIVVMK